MEQIKFSSYSVPGIRRVPPIGFDQVNLIIQTFGLEWFLEAVMNSVLDTTKTTKVDLFSKSRKPEFVIARHLLRFYECELLNSVMTLKQISLHVSNGRIADHSSVLTSKEIILGAMGGKDKWGVSILNYINQIDSRLNQITV